MEEIRMLKAAKIEFSSQHYSTSYMIVDENGKMHNPPRPDPVCEELTVTEGEFVKGFTVVGVTDEYLQLQSDLEYLESGDWTPKTQFLCKKGCRLDLQMCGVFDAVHKISITYVMMAE